MQKNCFFVSIFVLEVRLKTGDKMIVFIDGEYVKEEDAKVSVNDRAYVFADGAYEGFRVYNEKIFKYEEHKIRFQRSLDELRIDHVKGLNITSSTLLPGKHIVNLGSYKKGTYLVTLTHVSGEKTFKKVIYR